MVGGQHMYVSLHVGYAWGGCVSAHVYVQLWFVVRALQLL